MLKEESKVKKKVFLILLAVVLAISLGFLACTTPAQEEEEEELPIEITYHTPFPSMMAREEVFSAWFEKVEELSGGAVEFVPYYSQALFGMTEGWDHITRRTVDIAFVGGRFTPEIHPLTTLQMSFWYGVTPEQVGENYYLVEEAIPQLAAEWDEVKTLVIMLAVEHQLLTTTPIRTLEDAQGLLLNTAAPTGIGMFNGLGVIPSNYPGIELYSYLDKGTIDGALHTFTSLRTESLAEVCPYVTLINYTAGHHCRVVMNVDSWNSLPSNVQQIIDESLPELQEEYTYYGVTLDRELAVEFAEDNGVEFIELTAEELATLYEWEDEEILKLVEEADAQGLPGTELFNFIRQLVQGLA